MREEKEKSSPAEGLSEWNPNVTLVGKVGRLNFFSALHLPLTFGGLSSPTPLPPSGACVAYASQTASSLLRPVCSAAAYSGFTQQHPRAFHFPKWAGGACACWRA